ncbi:MAG: PTS sugar transporter subunit IIA [Kiritimatiellae bacterium]|nr:PTS sugar transporter subunit IIA [Kiritimatiellia bacterium]MDD5520615.1 PTS sugar transporter subunit IIA [Kiritimatiellia bacterium]
MDFKSTLKKGCFCLQLKSDTKEGVIHEMIDLLDAAGKLPDKNAALNAVLEREKKMSTGMQCGVAIPHGKTDTIDDLLVAFAMKKEGIEFGSLDGQPSTIFVMTISSSNRTGPHIQYLAEISKVLNVPSVRERLLVAQTVDEVVTILTGGTSISVSA